MRDLSFVAMGRRCRDETPPPYWRIFLSSTRTEGVWSHRPCLTFVAMDRRCPIKTPPPYWRTSNIVHRSFQHAHGRCMVLALPPAVSNIRRDGQEVSHQDTTPVLENVQYRPSFFPARARTV